MSCVLIVEDDDDVREFMELLLSTSGYETMSAAEPHSTTFRLRRLFEVSFSNVFFE